MQVFDVAGFKVIHYHKPGPITTVRAVFNAGSCREKDPADYGAAHYLEHMFFKGTQKKDYKQLDKELSALGDHNAYTNFDKTAYYINCLDEDFRKAFILLCELLFESRFDEKEFAKENTVIQEEIQMYLDDPTAYFSDKVFESVWGKIAHNIAGTKQSVSAMTVDTLLRFKKNYDKANMVFVIVGGVDEATVLAALKDVLPTCQCAEGNIYEWPEAVPFFGNEELTHTSTQALLNITMKGISSQEARKRRYVDDLFLNALGQSSHSALFERIRQELGLCYAVGAYDSGWARNNATNIYTMIDPKNIDFAYSEIMKVYDRVKQEGFSDEVLDISRKNILYRICRSLETADRIAHIMFDGYFVDGVFDPDDFRQGIMSITNKDIIAYANEIISDGTKVCVMNRDKA